LVIVAEKRAKRTVSLTPNARSALDRSLEALPGGGNYIDVMSRLVLWFEMQPLWVKIAVMSVGAGQETLDPGRAKDEVIFDLRAGRKEDKPPSGLEIGARQPSRRRAAG